MKKTIFLNGRFLNRPITGVQRVAMELVKALDELLDQPEINASNEYNFILIYSGHITNQVDLKHIKLLQKGIFTGNLWEQFELPIYTAGNLLVSLCTISTLFKKKQVVMVHDASFFVNPQFFSRAFIAWYKFALPLLAKISRQIITVSEFSKNELIKYGDFKSDKITIIPNAANHILKFGEPSTEFSSKIDALKPYCLAVSSLGANKNFKGLSEAINLIDFSRYNMLIAGGVIGALKQQAVNDNSVQYLGYVSDAELKYLYQHASLFIFPSFYEGFGIPPLEAMSFGAPVIASNTSAIPEVLDDACVYFDPSNINSMADEINSLINDSERLTALKNKSLKRASLFNWQKSAIKFFDLIKKYS